MLMEQVVPRTKCQPKHRQGISCLSATEHWRLRSQPASEEPGQRPTLAFQGWSGKSLCFAQFFNACSSTPQGSALILNSIMTDKERNKER